MPSRGAHAFVTVVFAATIASVPILQTAVEIGKGRRVVALDVLSRAPTAESLRAWERSMEGSSIVAAALRPWMQCAQLAILGDAGEKAVLGSEGWLFYRPGLRYATQREPPGSTGRPAEAVAAIVAYRDALARRGIRLLVVPVPDKESVYPEKLTGRAKNIIVCLPTAELLEGLRAAGVEVVDLFEEFRQARASGTGEELYLAQDTHWSPAGLRLAAGAVARRLEELRWVQAGSHEYGSRLAPVRRLGDLARMLDAPPVELLFGARQISCEQVVAEQDGSLYADAPGSDILVLGDSFLRVFEKDEPGAAGFIAHLAKELRRPLSSIVNDGGASTLVRQELHRRGRSLEGKRVVIWEFVERDIRLGTEGWQVVPLPPED